MPGNLQGSGTSGASESLDEATAPESPRTLSGSMVQHPCFQHWLSPRPAHGACGSEFFSDTPAMSIERQYPQEGPDSRALSGTCRQKDLGVTWSNPFKIRGYGHSPIATHILLTPYWACGLLGRQKPRSFPEMYALSLVAVQTWRPSWSPWNGFLRASCSMHPSGGSRSGGARPTDHQDSPDSDPGRLGSPERHAALGEGRSLWKEEAPSAMMPEKGQGVRSS